MWIFLHDENSDIQGRIRVMGYIHHVSQNRGARQPHLQHPTGRRWRGLRASPGLPEMAGGTQVLTHSGAVGLPYSPPQHRGPSSSDHVLLHNYFLPSLGLVTAFLPVGKHASAEVWGPIARSSYIKSVTFWKKYIVRARKSWKSILYRLLLFKVLHQRIPSDLWENQISCRDLSLF